MEESYGLISLLPVTVVIISAIITKRSLEPLLLGALVGYFILAKWNFVVEFLSSTYTELGESAYFIIIFGLFGIYIKLLEDANAISGFTKLCLKFANTKKKTGVLTWVMGIAFFLDNYFSILGNAVSNRKVSDKNKMSREMLTFTANLVACAICILVPVSLWGIFMAGQIEGTLGLEPGAGIAEVAKAVPFMFYAWISLIFVLLYQLRIIPVFGPMRKAELRAENGEVLPPEVAGEHHVEEEEKPDTNIFNFLVPMISLIAVALITKELTYGLLVGIAFCFVLYIPQKMLKFEEACNSICTGFSDMMVVTAIVITAFVLQNANEALGLAPFVIDSVMGIMSANLLPVVTFAVLLVLGFVTGSFWGMASICFPIVLPLAQMMDANLYLTIGAVITGASAGSTVCFYCDSVTLTCGITKIQNIHYARTALPLTVPIIIVTLIVFTAAGFIL